MKKLSISLMMLITCTCLIHASRLYDKTLSITDSSNVTHTVRVEASGNLKKSEITVTFTCTDSLLVYKLPASGYISKVYQIDLDEDSIYEVAIVLKQHSKTRDASLIYLENENGKVINNTLPPLSKNVSSYYQGQNSIYFSGSILVQVFPTFDQQKKATNRCILSYFYMKNKLYIGSEEIPK